MTTTTRYGTTIRSTKRNPSIRGTSGAIANPSPTIAGTAAAAPSAAASSPRRAQDDHGDPSIRTGVMRRLQVIAVTAKAAASEITTGSHRAVLP
jgi:hypothetical protein